MKIIINTKGINILEDNKLIGIIKLPLDNKDDVVVSIDEGIGYIDKIEGNIELNFE